MRAVVQVVKSAQVLVSGQNLGDVGPGLLVYLGIASGDSDPEIDYTISKILGLRIFPDHAGKLNCSVEDIGGEILVISQFTLYGDARKGRRPSYPSAAPPGEAEGIYVQFLDRLKKKFDGKVQSGKFQAEMDVISHGAGPVTILLDSSKLF